NPGGRNEGGSVFLEAAGDPDLAGTAGYPVGTDLRGQPIRVDLPPALRYHLRHCRSLWLDGTLHLAGGRQPADRELRPVPPAPPGRHPGDPAGGRCAWTARVYEIVITYNRRYRAYAENEEVSFGSIV